MTKCNEIENAAQEVWDDLDAETEIERNFKIKWSETQPIDVLVTLIDRLRILQKEKPTRQQALAITKLEEAYMWISINFSN